MSEKRQNLVTDQPIVVNIGLLEFFESLIEQEVETVHVDWRPPASGDEQLLDLLDELL
jgi:hypothetical protein